MFLSISNGGFVFFSTPSKIASNITAKAKYGLQEGSGDLNSTLVAFPLFAGTLINAERFANDHAKYTGASNPGTILL